MTRRDKVAAELINDTWDFFRSARPAELSKSLFEALKFRWGFIDGRLHTLRDAAARYDAEAISLLMAEASFLNRLGWYVDRTERARKRWLSL